MEWETSDLLAKVLAGNDTAQRQGAADVCAQGLLNTGDELVLACVRRFVTVFGATSADLARGAAADARHIGRLLVRAYVQATSPARRSEILDLLDRLLLLGSYGVAEAVNGSGRR
ncbi:hypothetical protein AB0D83_01895 [Streptomyces decoyicus]|uniref:hypothetical protein n=1 Tax=Streptomyces decoyicus TaxID=249567 RepID=UPI0033C46D05